MNGREMFRQTKAKQTNAQTQAGQLNKQMVESAGRLAAATVTTPQTNDLIFKLRISREFEFIQLICLYCDNYPKQIYNPASKFEREFLKIRPRIVHFLSNMPNVAVSRCCFVKFCKQLQRSEQRIITHAYTAIILVAVAVKVSLIELSKTE